MSIIKRTQKKLTQKEAAKNRVSQLSKKIVSSMLAVSFAISGFASDIMDMRIAKAAEGDNGIVRAGGTDNLMKDNVANIYAEEVTAAGSVGLNRFQYFDVKNNEIANLFFHKEGATQNVNTLVNMVQNQINITGTVNAVRNNQIGGNLFFLSPKGMVVNASGVINAGALTVMTPPEDFFNKAAYGIKTINTKTSDGKETTTKEFVTTNIWTADSAKVANYLALQGPYLTQGKMAGIDDNNVVAEVNIPINGSGTIAVHGTVNAATAIALSAANIEIGKKAGDNAVLRTGVVFENTVNAGVFTSAAVKAGEKLTATVNEEGNIVLVDPSNPNDPSKTDDPKANYISKTTTTEVSTITTTTDKIKTTVTKNSEAPKTTDATKTTTVTETISTSVAEFADSKGEDKTTEAVFSKETDKEYTKPADTADTKYAISNDKKTLTTTVTKSEKKDNDTIKTVTETKATAKTKTSEAGKDTDTAGTKSAPKTEVKFAEVKDGNVIAGDGSISLRATTDEVNYKADDSSGMVKFASWFGVNADPSKVTIKATLKDLLSETDFAELSNELLKTSDDQASLIAVWNKFISRANDTMKTEVTVGEGATIQAVGNAEISSTAVLNQTIGAEDGSNLSKQLAQTKAITTVNGKVTGADVNISATAESSFKSEISAGLGSILTENKKISNLTKLLPNALKSSKAGSLAEQGVELLNELNVALGLTNSDAKVTIGEKADLKAEILKQKDGKPYTFEKAGDDGNKEEATVGGNVNINATSKTTTDIQFALQPKVQSGDTAGESNILLNGGFVWEQTGANAVTTVNGKAKINSEGNTVIGANSTNSATAGVAIEGAEKGKTTVPAYFNAAVGLVNQNNNAKVVLTESGEDASINAGVGLIVNAVTDTSTTSTIGVKADDNEAVSTAVNVINIDNTATVENKAKLTGGLVSVSANGIVTGYDVNTSNSYGPEAESAFKKFGDKVMTTKFVKSTQDKIEKLLKIPANNNNTNTEDKDKPTAADKWNQYFDIGAAVAVANASNQAKVDLQAGSVLNAAAGVDVNSGITILDSQMKTTSVLAANRQKLVVGVSAAVGVENLTNKADTIVADGVQLATASGDVSVTAGVDDGYNRLAIMNEALKASWDMVKKNWGELGPDIKKTFETQWGTLTKSMEALLKFESPGKSQEVAAEAAKAAAALETLQESLGGTAMWLAATGTVLKTYTDAANWANMYTAATSRATQISTEAKAMATGTVGIQNITDKANVNIGSNAQLLSLPAVDGSGNPVPGVPQGTVTTAANTNSGNVLVSGKWNMIPAINSTSGGNFGIGGTVGLQNADSKSEVTVKKGVTLSGGEIDVNAKNNVMNVGVAVGGSKAGTAGVTGMTSYMGGSSNSIVQVDAAAVLNAVRAETTGEDGKKIEASGKINIAADNKTVLTAVAGEVTRASVAALGASAGVISYDVHSKALVGNIEKAGATWNANGVDITAKNSGVINNLTVAGVSAVGQKSEEAAGEERSGIDIQVRDNTSGKKKSLNETSVNSEGIGGNKKEDGSAPEPQSDSASDPDNGNGAASDDATEKNTQSASKVNIAVAGSASWNDIDERTEAKLSQVTLNFNEYTSGADNRKANVQATDSTFIGAYSGATAITKAGNTTGGSSGGFEASLSGAAAVNNIYKNSAAEIDKATINNELEVNNKAENSGTQVAAGVALGIQQGDRTKSVGFNVDASGSFNFINSTVKAQVKESNIAGSSAANVNLNNTAYDKDVQVAGGLSVGYIKSSAGIGAAIAVNKVNNNITADITGNTLGSVGKGLNAVNNFAVSKLNQVGGAISLGIVPKSSRNYVTANAAVVVNNVKNNLNASGADNTIYTKKLDVKASDGELTKSETANEYIAKLKNEGFDVADKAGDVEAVKLASEKKDTDVATEDDGSVTTIEETVKQKNLDNEDEDRKKVTVKYTQNNVDVSNGGNIIVGSAMNLIVNAGKTSGASLGAAVAYNKIDNDFKAKLSGGSVNITAADTEKAPSVKVAANSDTLQVGVSAGVAVQTGGKGVKGAAAAGSVTIQRAENETTAAIENINIKADHTSVTAYNKSTQTTVAGLASVSGVNAAIGMTWAQNNLNNITGAYAKGITLDKFSLAADKTANLNLNSTNESKTLAVGAAVDVSLNLSGKDFSVNAAGAYAANKGTNSTEAVMDKYDKDSVTKRNIINNAGKITATANDTSTLKGIAGNISVNVGISKPVVGVAIGGAVVNNSIGTAGNEQKNKQQIKAVINETDVTSTAATKVEAEAKNDAKIVAVGAGGSVAVSGFLQIGAQGSVAISNINTNTFAGMENTNIDKDDTAKHNAVVNVKANSNNKVIDTADALSVSAGTGIQVSAMGAVAKVTSNANTTAEISGGKQNVKSELVQAVSDSKLTNVAAAVSVGVGGPAGAAGSGNVAINNIGNNTIADIKGGAVINASDSLGVLAKSSEALKNYGGAISVGASAKVGVSLGATVVVNKITGDTKAVIDGSTVSAKGNGTDGSTVSAKGNGTGINVDEYEYKTTAEKDLNNERVLTSVDTKKTEKAKTGLVVNADAKHTLNDISVTGGVGGSALVGVGVNATVITNTINGNTKAEITNTDVNKTLADMGEKSNVAVHANDALDVSSHVGTLSVGIGAGLGVAAAASVDVNDFNRTTTAAITGKTGRNTVNANAAEVKALGSTKLLLSESGLSVGGGLTAGIGATGVVSKNKFTNNVSASMSNINGQQNQLNIDADSVKLLHAYTNAASVSGGYAAVAATASVINTTDTSATKAELINSTIEVDKKKKSNSKVNVQANNLSVLGSQTAGGALAIGFGGAAGVTVANNNITNTVSTVIKNSNIGTEADAYKEFSAKSVNNFTDKFLNISVAGGLASVGVGVANNTINSATLTNIDGGNVYADKIDIIANEKRTLKETMVGAGVGFVGINTNVAINTIGGAMLDTYIDETAKEETKKYDTNLIQNWSLKADKEAQELNNKLVANKITEGMFTKDKNTLTYDKGAKSEGVQTVINGANLKSTGNVNIENHATTNTDISVGQGSFSTTAGIDVSVVNTTVGSDSGVTVTGGDLQGANVNIKALSDGEIKQKTVQVGASLGLKANVVVSNLTKEGNNLITIGDNKSNTIIRAGSDRKSDGPRENKPTLTILADDRTTITNSGTSVSGSAVGATAQIIKAKDYSDNKVEIKGKADLAAFDYVVKDEIIKLEPGRAGTVKDVKGNILYTITNSTADGKDVTVIKDGADKTVRTIEFTKATAVGKPDKTVVKDAAGNVQYTIEYTKATTEDGQDKTVVKDKDGKVITGTSPIQSPWNLTYTSEKLDLGKVDVKAVNNNSVNADISSVGVSAIDGSGIVVRAEEGKRDNKGEVSKGTTGIKVEGNNIFKGNDVSLSSENRAKVYAKEFGVGLSLLSASVFNTTANLQGAVETNVGDGQTFAAKNLTIGAEAIQPTESGKYSAEAYTQAISTGGGNVAVNHAYAKASIDTKLSVGNETYQTVNHQEIQIKDTYSFNETTKDSKITSTEATLAGDKLVEGGTNLNLKAQSTVSTKSNVTGINGSIISVGSNNAVTENKNTVTLKFNPGTYKADSLTLAAGVTDNVITTANGDGGSIVGVSPYAARTKHTNASSTVIDMSGNYELTGDMKVMATTGLNQDMLASAVQASIAGGSGTIGESKTENRAKVNLADNTNIKAGGKIDIGAFNNVEFNKNREYAVKGNGFGGIEMAVAKMNNEVTTYSDVNLSKAQIASEGSQTYSAETNNDLKSQVYVLSAGVIAGAHGENTIKVDANNSVKQGANGLLSVYGKGEDIAIGAVDDQALNTRAMVDNVGGAVAGSSAITNNNVIRTNTVNIDGKLFSRHDVKLFAGEGANGEMGQMNLVSSAEAMTMGLIPVALPPQINNKFIQTNKVNVNTSGDVQAVRNVYLYADAGKEITDLFSGRYTMYAGKGKSTYAATTNGISNVEGRDGVKGKTADNVITVHGSVLAGAGNAQKFTIGKTDSKTDGKTDGKTDMLVVTSKEQYDVIQAYYDKHPNVARQNVVLVLSDADYDKQEGSFGNRTVKKLSEIIEINDRKENYTGLTAADFKLGESQYAVARLARLNELRQLMTENKDTDPTAYVGYKADYDRIYNELKDAKLVDKDGNILEDFTVNTIELPDLVASGGNVIANSSAFKGKGSVIAKGNPEITVTNNTTLAMGINDITIYELGGEIYYNNVALDTNSNPQKLNGAGVTVMKADKGKESKINIEGKNAISEVKYRLNDMKEEKDRDQTIPVKADIVIRGQVVAEGGDIKINSQSDSIILEGKTAKDAAAVVGKSVSMTAGGGIAQSYKDDIENIGGDPQDQFGNKYENYKYTEKKSDVYNQNAGVVVSSESRVSAGNIYINAADININGTIQSGYDKYYVNLSDTTMLDKDNKVVDAGIDGAITLEARIKQIIAANGGKTVTDESVIGNPNYQVVSGSKVKNNDKGYYDYMINVYYNPSGNGGKGKLLTENIDSKGGRVYLTGRISSTGSGEIYCLDGTYNIDVNNTSKYLLQTGKMVVNDTVGEVKITDTNQNTITTITRNDDGTLNKKFEVLFDGKSSAGQAVLSGANSKYDAIYNPQSGLRYNWTTGFDSAQLNTYRKSWYNARWGKGDSHDVMRKTLINTEKEIAPINVGPSATVAKRNGAYIGTVDKAGVNHFFDVVYTYKDTIDYTKITNTRKWSQGMYGVHKYTEVTWDHLKGSSSSFLASVKADNPVGIKFIGDAKSQSTVKVNSDAGLIVGGDMGNRQLYESDTSDIARNEKGIVNLISNAGSISQTGGNIYGIDVNLAAKGSVENISITAGDSVNLKAEKLGAADNKTRNISVLVNSNKNALGNVLVKGNFGSADTDFVALKTSGNSGDIKTDTGTVIEGSRIDLVSENGSINAIVNAGQTFVGTDTLAASVNATAAKDINLTQQSGDMRIGRIYSSDGDVTLNTTKSFVDALPYSENSAGTEKELVEKWLRAGIISDTAASEELQDASKEMLAEKNAAMSKASSANNFMKEESVRKDYARYEELKKIKRELFENEKEELNYLKGIFEGYTSASSSAANKFREGVKIGYARYTELSGKSGLNDDQKKELNYWQTIFTGYTSADDYLSNNEAAKAQQEDRTYQVWDKNALLYSIQQSIINQTADTLPKTSSKNPNVKGNNITLNAVDSAGLLSENITEMHIDILGDSNAKDKNNQSGLDNLKTLARADASNVIWDSEADGGRGVITIIQKLPIGIQTNKADGKLTVGKYDGGKLNNLKGNAFLEGRITANEADGKGNKDITIDTIRATGGVSISSLGAIINGANTGTAAITAEDLNISAVGSIGTKEKLLTTDLSGGLRAVGYSLPTGKPPSSGGIYLDNIGNNNLKIAAVSTGGELKLHAKKDITMLDNKANVKGVIQTEHDGDIELISREGNIGSADKLLLVKNTSGDNSKLTVGAKNNIYLEGISTAPDQRAAGGQMNLILLDEGKEQGGSNSLENIKVNVNGILNMLNGQSAIEAKKSIELNAANGLMLKDSVIKTTDATGMITLNAGQVITVHGNESIDSEAALIQGNGILETANLYAISTGNLILGSEYNKLNNVYLDNRSKANVNNTVILGNAGSHGLNVEVHNTLAGQDDTVHGTLFITKYENTSGAAKSGTGIHLKGAKVTGDISVVNDEDDILNEGNVTVTKDGNITMKAKQDIVNNGDVTVSHDGSITMTANHDIVNNRDVTVSHDGSITMKADQNIVNAGNVTANHIGNITMTANKDITIKDGVIKTTDASSKITLNAGKVTTVDGKEKVSTVASLIQEKGILETANLHAISTGDIKLDNKYNKLNNVYLDNQSEASANNSVILGNAGSHGLNVEVHNTLASQADTVHGTLSITKYENISGAAKSGTDIHLKGIKTTGDISVVNDEDDILNEGNVTVTKDGNITMKAKQDIISVDNGADIKWVIQTENDGDIELISREGNIGSADKLLLVKNTSGDKSKLTVGAKNNIYLEGISTAPDQRAAGGQMNLILLDEGKEQGGSNSLENIKVNVNGILNMLNGQSAIEAKKSIELNAANGLMLKDSVIKTDATGKITLNAGQVTTVHGYENINPAASLIQENGSLETANLHAISTGNLILGSKYNKLNNVYLDNRSKANANNSVILGNAGSHGLNVEVHNTLAGQDDTIHGTLSITKYENTSGAAKSGTGIHLNGVKTTGDISVVNDEDDILSEGNITVTNDGNITMKAKQDITMKDGVIKTTDTSSKITLNAGQVTTVQGNEKVNTVASVIQENSSLEAANLSAISTRDIKLDSKYNKLNNVYLDNRSEANANNIVVLGNAGSHGLNVEVHNNLAGQDDTVHGTLSITKYENTSGTAKYGTDIHLKGAKVTGDISVVNDEDSILNESNVTVTKDGNITMKANHDIVNNRDVTVNHDGSITMTANHDIVNNRDVTVNNDGSIAMTAKHDIFNAGNATVNNDGSIAMTANHDIVNSGDITVSHDGSITMKADQNIVNAGNVTVNNDGSITMTANHDIVNNRDVTVNHDGSITMTANHDIVNNRDVTVNHDGGITMTANHDIVNAGNITINHDGNINMTADHDIVNGGDITVNHDGNIIMTAYQDIFNGDAGIGNDKSKMLTAGKGDINLEAKAGSVYNFKEADLLATDGNVTISATNSDKYSVYYYDDAGNKIVANHETIPDVDDIVLNEDGYALVDGKYRRVYIEGSVFNAGDIIAIGGNISLKSLKGDIYNFDDFNTIDDENGKLTYQYGSSAVISTGNVVITAPEGMVYNTQDIASDGNVTLTAKEGLDSLSTSIYAGENINLTATDGDLVNNAKLISLNGDISLTAEKGTVVNMLDGDILALGGSVTLHAGQKVTDITDGKRPIYTVDTIGIVNKLDIDLEADKMIVVDKYYLADGNSASTAVLIDDTVDTTTLTQAQKDSIYGVISYYDTASKKKIAIKAPDGSQLKINGDIEVYRLGDVVNRGDVVALGKTIEQPDGTFKQDEVNRGSITMVSDYGNISNYDNFTKVDGKESYEFKGTEIFNKSTKFYTDKKYLIAYGDIRIEVPEGYFYNNINYIGKSNIEFISKGDISIGKAETAGLTDGRLMIRSIGGKVIGSGDLTAGGGIVLDAAKGIDLDKVKLTSDSGLIRIATDEGGISVASEGSKILAGESISIGAKSGDIDMAKADVEAKKMAAVGTQDGDVKVNEINGNEVVLYTSGENKNIVVNKVNAGDYLVLRGDNINLKEVNHTNSSWLHVDVARADGGTSKGLIKANIAGDTHFSTFNANNADINVTDGGKLAIDKLHITGKGHFNAMDYKTAVYGTVVSNDDSKAVYFDTGDGNGKLLGQELNLEKMLFGAYGTDIDEGDIVPSYKKPIYVADIRNRLPQERNHVGTFAKDNDGWMNLYIDKPNFQRSNGLLLNIEGNYYANHQRYAANDLSTMVSDIKPVNVFNGYYKDFLGFFDRYNLIDGSAYDGSDFTVIGKLKDGSLIVLPLDSMENEKSEETQMQ